MRLGLSSAAAPGASLDELLAACQRRGLAALELAGRHAHGATGASGAMGAGASGAIGASGATGAGASEEPGGCDTRDRVRAAGVVLAGFRSDGRGRDVVLAEAAAAAEAPVLVAGGNGLDDRIQRAVELREAGAEVAVVLPGDVSDDGLGCTAAEGLPVTWDADGKAGDLGTAVVRILERTEGRLRHIRLSGGGPETAMQEGRGIGVLMARLALAGYAGDVILTPSSPRFRVAWETWLGRRGGLGCGSKTADPSLVALDPPVTAARRDR